MTDDRKHEQLREQERRMFYSGTPRCAYVQSIITRIKTHINQYFESNLIRTENPVYYSQLSTK
jgi:hypothetical protein